MPDAKITISAEDAASAVMQSVGDAATSMGDAVAGTSAASAAAGDALGQTGDAARSFGDAMAAGAFSAADLAAATAAVSQPVEDTRSAFQRFADQLGEVGEDVKGLGESLTSGIENPMETAKTAVSGFLEELGPVGVGLSAIGAAAAGVGGALFEMADQAAEVGEGVLNFSRVTGTAVDSVGALSAGATIAGGSLDSMQSMLTQMQRRLDATGPAADKLNAGLADLGINAEAFRAADPTERINLLAAGMQASAGSTTLMSDALAVMGRAGVQNIGFLMQYTDEARESGDALGVTWDTVTTKAAEDLGIATRTTGVEFSTLATTIGVALIPAATVAVDGFNRMILALEHVADLGGLVSGGWDMLTGALGRTALATETYNAVQDTADHLFQQAKTSGLDLADAAYQVAEKMLALGYSVQNVSSASGLGVEAIKELQAELKATAIAADAFAAAWDEINYAESNGKVGMESLTASVKAQIIEYQNLGQSVQTIATALQIAPGLVNDVEAAHTKAAAAANALAKAEGSVIDALYGIQPVSVATVAALKDMIASGDDFSHDTVLNMAAAIEKLYASGQKVPPMLADWYGANAPLIDDLESLTQQTQDAADAANSYVLMANAQADALKAVQVQLQQAAQNFVLIAQAADNAAVKTAQATQSNLNVAGQAWQKYTQEVNSVTEDQYEQQIQKLDDWAQAEYDKVNYAADGWETAVAGIELAWDQGMDNIEEAAQAASDAAWLAGQTAGTSFADGLTAPLDAAMAKFPGDLTKALIGGGGLTSALKSLANQLGADFGKELTASINQNVSSGGNGLDGASLGSAAGVGAIAGVSAANSGASLTGQLAQVTEAGVAVAATAALTTSATLAASVALGAMTMGVGAAVIGIVALWHAFSGVSETVKEGRSAFQTYEDAVNQLTTSTEKAAAGNSEWAQDVQTLSDAYVTLGYSSSEAQSMAQTQWNALAAAQNQGAAAVKSASAVITTALTGANTASTTLSTGVASLVSEAQNLGEVMPASLVASIAQLAKMPGLTTDETTALNGLVAAAAPNYASLTSMAANYGLTLAQLGPTFQQQNIDSTAKGIFNDFTALTQAGADVGGVLQGMSPKIQQLVTDSMNFGTAIPDDMKPLIANLIQAGDLTDANGKKLTDVSQITFEDTPVDTGLTGMQTTLSTLTTTLSNLPGVIASVTNSIPNNPFANWKVPDMPNAPGPGATTVAGAATGGMVTETGISYFGQGGFARGTDTVPAMLTPGEMILTPSQQRSVGGVSPEQINEIFGRHMERLGDHLERIMAQQPGLIRHALRGAR